MHVLRHAADIKEKSQLIQRRQDREIETAGVDRSDGQVGGHNNH